jgi:hypothetical protein
MHAQQESRHVEGGAGGEGRGGQGGQIEEKGARRKDMSGRAKPVSRVCIPQKPV